MRLNRRSLQTVAVFVITLALAVAVTLWNDTRGAQVVSDPAASSSEAASSAQPSTESGVRTGDRDPETGLAWILESDLPPEGRDTLRLIDRDGPYPFDRDGLTFENREGILPDERFGYYREFTVIDPGSVDRGPLRIVAGSGGEFYYTVDHYGSFRRIWRG